MSVAIISAGNLEKYGASLKEERSREKERCTTTTGDKVKREGDEWIGELTKIAAPGSAASSSIAPLNYDTRALMPPPSSHLITYA